jgi:protein gp37
MPFFFKQWGEYGSNLVKIGKKEAGRLLDGREWDQFPLAG